MLNIVLVEPEIPANTGNISRTCAVTGAALHLVYPLGFSIDEKHLRRAGLDYWDKLNIYKYENLDDFFNKNKGGEFFYFSTKAHKKHTDIKYPKDAYLIFGKETKGLPSLYICKPRQGRKNTHERTLRCLNLSNSVAVAAYEYLRQQVRRSDIKRPALKTGFFKKNTSQSFAACRPKTLCQYFCTKKPPFLLRRFLN